jgi:hypothetical protein
LKERRGNEGKRRREEKEYKSGERGVEKRGTISSFDTIVPAFPVT